MKKFIVSIICLGAFSAGVSSSAFAEKYITRDQPVADTFIKKYGKSFYVVSQIGNLPVPDVLERLDRKGRVANALEWSREARGQILEFFDSQVYGAIPPRPDSQKFELIESSDDALGGIALRRQYRITVSGAGGSLSFVALVYLPKNGGAKTPAFICPNFYGNFVVSPEDGIATENYAATLSEKKRAQLRAGKSTRVPVANIVSRGYAIATFCYMDVYPDRKGESAADESVYKIFGKKFDSRPAIVAWAWGNMRVADLLETLPEIDMSKLAVVGHSRLGKTALITGAHDLRFAYVCSNNAGCMGEALTRRNYGESAASMVDFNFPYWFSSNFKKHAHDVSSMPVDQHHLVSLIAPRMLYTTSSSEDFWADPEGQLLGLINAAPAFALFGAKNFPTLDALEIDSPFHGDIAYHIKSGRHSITPYDWKNFMDYAEKRGWKPVPPKK